jgi:hypothetical protein
MVTSSHHELLTIKNRNQKRNSNVFLSGKNNPIGDCRDLGYGEA